MRFRTIVDTLLTSRMHGACVHRTGAWCECMRVQVCRHARRRVRRRAGAYGCASACECVGACVRVCVGMRVCMRGCASACMRVRGCARVCVRVQVCVHMCVRVCTYETLPPLKFLGSFPGRVRMVGFSWLFQEFQLVDR